MNRQEAGRLGGLKGGRRLATLTAQECICDKCGRPLTSKMRKILGKKNHYDDIGLKGGQAIIQKYGKEHMSEIGKLGGRGNKRTVTEATSMSEQEARNGGSSASRFSLKNKESRAPGCSQSKGGRE